MRSRRVDRLFGVKRIGKIDTAELERLGVAAFAMRMSMPATFAPRPARFQSDLPSAPSAPVDDDHFSVHFRSPRQGQLAYRRSEITCNGGAFCGEIIGTT